VSRLIELKSSGQISDRGRRRWFTSTDLDLIAWFDENDSLSGFELYYDKNVREHVFIWRADGGFEHLAVDDGEQKPVLEYKEAPLLVPDGHVDPNRISHLFEGSCRGLPTDLAAFVGKKLKQHPDYIR
jgi:hypothetical protein